MIVYLLAFYLLFMFRYFKTSISFNHPLEYIMINRIGEYYKHPLGIGLYESKICPFGQDIIILLILFVILRSEFNWLKKYSKYVLIIAITISLLNLNATIYLIPYFLFEYIYNI